MKTWTINKKKWIINFKETGSALRSFQAKKQ
jgi:hypothetical protein